MRFRFVRPTTRRLDLGHQHWVLVRDRLTAGDEREMFKRYYVRDPDGTRRYDPFEAAIATVVAYLLDWSVTDEDGAPVDIRDQPVDVVRSAIDNLEAEDYTAIKDAIDAHVAAMTRERAEEKKLLSGAMPSSAT